VVTTPAYMLGPGIKDVASGIEKLVNKVLSLLLSHRLSAGNRSKASDFNTSSSGK
jgi:hypothetical protein